MTMMTLGEADDMANSRNHPPQTLPVVGRDYQLAEPDEDVMQDRRERIEWYNLSPEQRFRLANQTWHQWNKLRTNSVNLAIQSLHNRFGRAQ